MMFNYKKVEKLKGKSESKQIHNELHCTVYGELGKYKLDRTEKCV